MGSIHNPAWIIGVQLLHSLTFGVFLITANRYLSQIIPDEYRSSGQAIFAVAWSSIAGLISGTIGGWIYDAAGEAQSTSLPAVYRSLLRSVSLLHIYSKTMIVCRVAASFY